MFQHNISRVLFSDRAMVPVAAGTGDTQNGDTIDTAGYESIVFLVYLGTLTSGAVTTIKLQYGSASDASDMADITSGSVSVPQSTGGGKVWWSVEVHRPTKRYLRVCVVRATANAVINGAVVLMGRAAIQPTQQGTNAAGFVPTVLVSP
jgi:hypothetical protein